MMRQQKDRHLLQSHGLGTLAGQVLVSALQLLTQLCYLISWAVSFRLLLLLLQELLMLLQQLTMRCSQLVYFLQNKEQSAIADCCALIHMYKSCYVAGQCSLKRSLAIQNQDLG